MPRRARWTDVLKVGYDGVQGTTLDRRPLALHCQPWPRIPQPLQTMNNNTTSLG